MEIPTVRPQSAAGTSASVTIAISVSSAIGSLPIADSNLAARAASNAWNFEATDTAVCVDTDTAVCVDTDTIPLLDVKIVAYTASAIGVVVSLDAKTHIVRTRTIVETGEESEDGSIVG